MPNMQTDEFLRRFQGILKDTWKLVQRKNEQYSTNDALANFTTGAELQYHDKEPEWQFETLKDYMLKHVAHVYNNRLMGNGVRESLGDIVTYCIIGMIMHDAINTRLPEPEPKKTEDYVDIKEAAYRIEQRILGAILIDGQASDIAMRNLAVEYFTAPQHQTILRAMIDIFPDQIDLISVTEKLKKWNKLQRVGGVAYLTLLANCIPNGKNIYHDIADLIDISERINENCVKASD